MNRRNTNTNKTAPNGRGYKKVKVSDEQPNEI